MKNILFFVLLFFNLSGWAQEVIQVYITPKDDLQLGESVEVYLVLKEVPSETDSIRITVKNKLAGSNQIYYLKFQIQDLYTVEGADDEFVFFWEIPNDLKLASNGHGLVSISDPVSGASDFFFINQPTSVLSPSEVAKLDVTVFIFNSQGQFIKESNSKNIKNNLSQGLYFFQASTNNQAYTGKFFVE